MAEGKGSLIMWLAATVGLAVVGAGVGGFLGITIVDKVKAFEKEQADRAPPPVATSTPRYGPNMALMDLPPIISNLADPPNAWVRLQAAIIYDAKAVPKPQMLAATVSSDVLAYLKTVTIAQIAGASGLDHLREDLNERVAIRSEGHIREIIIQTLVVQ
ncbi:MAG: flagellar basal body-associated protein FliL [Methylovirgula sp.]